VLQVFTIGHSTRTALELVDLLRAFEVQRLVDVRTVPRSRHNPQFNQRELGPFLHNRHISYRHLGTLGGLRHPHSDSPNTAWRNASFRGFADYMSTPAFTAGLDQLIRLSTEKRTAIMCAEAVPWRCHRSLIADALVARGIEVHHIMAKSSSRPHALNPAARVDAGGRVTYPGP
jgi:uncharacterized protein (DUF488 family)